MYEVNQNQVAGVPVRTANRDDESPKREPQAAVAMRRLGNASERLRTLLDRAEKRLDPVLSPACPEPCAPEAKVPTLLAGLPNALEVQARFIDENCDRLERMLSRLEV